MNKEGEQEEVEKVVDDGGSDDDCFLKLPASRASKAAFPPGCFVICCCYDGQKMASGPPKNAFLVTSVVKGRVKEVGVNMDATNEILYKIQAVAATVEEKDWCKKNAMEGDSSSSSGTTSTIQTRTFIAKEDDCQYSIGTPVWLSPPNLSSGLSQSSSSSSSMLQSAAVVIGVEHLPVFDNDEMQAKYPSTLYSVQTVQENYKIYHGITLKNLCFRGGDATATTTAATSNHSTKHHQVETTHQNNKKDITKIDLSVNESNGSQKVTGGESTTATNMTISNKTTPRIISSRTLTPPPLKTSPPPPPPTTTLTSTSNKNDNKDAVGSSNQPKEGGDGGGGNNNSTTKTKTTTKTTTTTVFNSAPFVDFRWVVYGKEHRIHRALETLRLLNNSQYIDRIIFETCLRYHLCGNCHTRCSRAWDHRNIMTPTRAKTLEEKLRYVISETGPIYCRPATPSHHHRRGGGGIITDPSSSSTTTTTTAKTEYHDNNDGSSNDPVATTTAAVVGHHHYYGHSSSRTVVPPKAEVRQPSSSLSSSTTTTRGEGCDLNDLYPPPPQAANKRIKLSGGLHTHATAVNLSSPTTTEIKGPQASILLALPRYFGVEFVVTSIMGETGGKGKELCNEFSCSITFGGPALHEEVVVVCDEDEKRLITDLDYLDPKHQFVAQLNGPSLRQLLQCQLKIEQILCSSAPPTLRGYMLYQLGMMNSFRDSRDGIVETLDPHRDSGSGNDLLQDEHVYIAIIKASKGLNRSNAGVRGSSIIVRFQDAEQCWNDRLQHKYPDCRIEMVTEPWSRTKIFPFIMLFGESHESIFMCRKEMISWCQSRQIA